MSDAYTELNPGADGNFMDEAGITYPTSPTLRRRPRVVIAGEEKDQISSPINTLPTGTEYAVLNRPIHTPYPGTNICELEEVTLVAASSETTVSEYTVPVDTTFCFLGFTSSGDVDAEYTVYVETTAKVSSRSTAAIPACQVVFPYAIFTVAAGDTVRLKAIHYKSGIQGNFKGTILGYLL